MTGCLSKEVLEDAIGEQLIVPTSSKSREGCNCLLGNDIGAYNSCLHLCRYCYANFDKDIVLKNHKLHDPKSPLLIGKIEEGDEIREHKAISYLDDQLTLF